MRYYGNKILPYTRVLQQRTSNRRQQNHNANTLSATKRVWADVDDTDPYTRHRERLGIKS